MVIPARTKPCTFPGCDGRMVLTRDQAVASRTIVEESGEPSGVWWFWECDNDRSHIEHGTADAV
jgi:hypothetical protein